MRRWSALVRLAVFLGVVASLMQHASRTHGVGEPILPDLQTLPPTSLSLNRERMTDGTNHYLLRFDNTVGNWGGPLEIVADLNRSRDLTQNVYDAFNNGSVVSSVKVASDLVYHPTHNHFHFQDFSTYLLLKKETNGTYQPTTRAGTKTSFCIVDTIRVTTLGTGASTNRTCTSTKQGLSAGWADVYSANTPEQWIDFGTSSPADGDYAIQSTTDPQNRLLESDDANNGAVTYFSIVSGKVSTVNQGPTCTLSPSTGPVGADTTLNCVRFVPGDALDLRWGNVAGAILTTLTVDETGSASATIVVPESAMGIHNLLATSRTTERSTIAVFTTSVAMSLQTTTGQVGSSVGFAMTGFAAGEKVTVRFTTTGSSTVTLATLGANANGSVTGSGVVPSAALGPHKVEAKGSSSKKAASRIFNVTQSMTLSTSSARVGSRVQIGLKGFKKSETVAVVLVETNKTLKSIRTSSSGAASPSTANAFIVPNDLGAGTYTIRATGASSGAIATAPLTVTTSVQAAGADNVETPRTKATITPKPTHTPRTHERPTDVPDEPTATDVSPTETPIPAPTLTAIAEPDALPVTEESTDTVTDETNEGNDVADEGTPTD